MSKRTPKDIRSTGRKRARAVLFRVARPYECAFCHRAPGRVPKEATVSPSPLNGTWEGMAPLQCNHINKNLLDCDPVNLEWLCPSCHKIKDSVTGVGVSIMGDEFGYGFD